MAPLVSLTHEQVREIWASWSEKKLAQAGQEAGLEAGFLTQEGEFSQFVLFPFLVFFCFFQVQILVLVSNSVPSLTIQMQQNNEYQHECKFSINCIFKKILLDM